MERIIIGFYRTRRTLVLFEGQQNLSGNKTEEIIVNVKQYIRRKVYIRTVKCDVPLEVIKR